ncbi:hypothetical protein LTR56_016193 [Elasticomyces elasticus]|nr:hypothetical protein LTR56_016193 [Elasticomyces elasticus]KAK3642152.1 hypothetical protein LTR22_016273 [Elasticomyces elasticus]KAK4914200.1 hypothetical protein LTR49_017553 [Elasticomyces elasticus]KAK5762561.1 hypothetical protein LTS12_007352 [Elasticomyces elasticus]
MATQVLALPELLETILLGLPIKDLLFAQKVCKTWMEVTEGSARIQKALFFIPGSSLDANIEATCPWDGRAIEKTLKQEGVALNPLLLENEWRKEMKTFEDHFCFKERVLEAKGSASCHQIYISQPPAYMRFEFNMRLPYDEPELFDPDDDGELVAVDLELGTAEDDEVGTFGDLVERWAFERLARDDMKIIETDLRLQEVELVD